MYREIVSIIIIIALVISIDKITQNYTNNSVQELNNELHELRDKIMNLKQDENENLKSEVENQIKSIYESWRKKYKKFSYYLEHDELEKVEVDLTNLKSYIEVKDYDMSIEETDLCMYVLNHIKEKEEFNLSNIF